MRRAALGAVAALLLFAAPAHATDYTVTTGADGTGQCPAARTPCTLRTALNNASQNGTGALDTITLPANIATYNITGGQFTVPSNVTITGPGADIATILGDGKSNRVMTVSSGAKVTIEGVTIAAGATLSDSDGFGGDILMAYGANLLLDHVRVTRGVALRGGGIATQGGGKLEIRNSLIDNNEARTGSSVTTADGGGILSRSISTTAGAQQLVVSDSTIVSNKAKIGAGITARDHPSNTTQLERVTIADNVSNNGGSALRGGGIYIGDAESFRVHGSILARNTANLGDLAPFPGLSNCGAARPTDDGGNVESGTDCGFTLANDRQSNDAGLALALVMDGGHTPVLPIPGDSVARELAGACTGFDQRDLARPQGDLCDAGAYEAVPPPVVVQATPTPTPTVAPVVTATPTPAPTPQFHQTVVIGKISGTVKVKLPGTSTYVDLAVTKTIPLKSTVDVRHGKVELTSVPKAGGKPETAVFYDGIFKVTQVGKITDLALVEPLAACPKGGAQAAAKKPKTRRLWGSGKGNFRTTGKYSAATIRGTTWLVQDSCAGTLTKVTQGVVSVRDNVKHKTLLVKAHHQYVAKPKR